MLKISQQLGPSALAGFAIFVILIPIQRIIMSHRLKVNRISLRYTDQRGGLLMEALSEWDQGQLRNSPDMYEIDAIRVVKFFCYEVPLLRRE
jgi:ATP-binding cassette, subfamily C (CFTR/MRP), member 1